MSDDVELVIAARSGDRQAFGTLAQQWFDRCWEVAWRILHDRDLAADVAQDTLMVAWQQLDRLQQPGSFGGWVLRIARNRALDRLAKERRAVPVADHDQLEPAVHGDRETRPEEAFARSQERDLVWAAAAALGERDASLLDLHLRHGLEPGELADELGITANAAHQALFRLRRRLGQTVRAWLLWRHHDPTCVVLRAELAAVGDAEFGAGTVRLIRRHVATCELCADEHDRVATPAALFAAAPLITAPALLRSRALAALADAGVPVGVSGGGGDDPGGHGSDGDAGGPLHGEHPGGGDTAGGDETVAARRADSTMVLRSTAHDGWPDRRRPSGTRLVPTALTLVVVAAVGSLLWLRADAAPPAGDDPVATEVASPVPVVVPSPEPSVAVVVPPPPPPPPPPSPPPPPPPTESETPTMPPAPPPVITRLVAIPAGPCRDVRAYGYQITWESLEAETATLTDPGGQATPVPVSGSAPRCAATGEMFTLEVTGPGGTATSTVEARPHGVQ